MSASEESSGGDCVRETAPKRYPLPFIFVNEGEEPHARSHVMRNAWRQRRIRNRRISIPTSHTKLLASCSPTLKHGEDGETAPDHEQVKLCSRESAAEQRHEYLGNETSRDWEGQYEANGIPAQIRRSMYHALSSVILYPCKNFAVELTSQHRKLLHHWFSIYAGMTFEGHDVSSFNPMRDVWLPLDLSNAASFNAVMAQSAAHLASLYSRKCWGDFSNSSVSVKYKIEAVTILRGWLSCPRKALSNETLAVTIRLLSFESCWGTTEEWNAHRAGLRTMIDARGGIKGLSDDWRLQIAVHLTSLMENPSWLVPGNTLPNFPDMAHLGTNTAGSRLSPQNVRSLWVISFIESMRTFDELFHQFYPTGLSLYPSLYEAILMLRNEYQNGHSDAFLKPGISLPDHDGLVCLFLICLVVQSSLPRFVSALENPSSLNNMEELEAALKESRGLWNSSGYSLRPLLHIHISGCQNGREIISYTQEMMEAVRSLKTEVRDRIRCCLLNILSFPAEGYPVQGDDDDCNPHSLLSTIRG